MFVPSQSLCIDVQSFWVTEIDLYSTIYFILIGYGESKMAIFEIWLAILRTSGKNHVKQKEMFDPHIENSR